MRRILILLVLVMGLQSARADAQNSLTGGQGPPDITEGSGPSEYFPGNTPNGEKVGPSNEHKPFVEPSWLDWLNDWMSWIWNLFMVMYHYCVEIPAEWLRGLCKSWFCWLGVGLLEFIGRVLQLDSWEQSMTVEKIRQGLTFFKEQAGFIGRVFPFTLWAGLAGLYLSIESALAAVKWIIGIIPGT